VKTPTNSPPSVNHSQRRHVQSLKNHKSLDNSIILTDNRSRPINTPQDIKHSIALENLTNRGGRQLQTSFNNHPPEIVINILKAPRLYVKALVLKVVCKVSLRYAESLSLTHLGVRVPESTLHYWEVS
jgi:hypothetical protein